jgi:hypothetical protein
MLGDNPHGEPFSTLFRVPEKRLGSIDSFSGSRIALGKIIGESELGEGSTYTIYLPIM